MPSGDCSNYVYMMSWRWNNTKRKQIVPEACLSQDIDLNRSPSIKTTDKIAMKVKHFWSHENALCAKPCASNRKSHENPIKNLSQNLLSKRLNYAKLTPHLPLWKFCHRRGYQRSWKQTITPRSSRCLDEGFFFVLQQRSLPKKGIFPLQRPYLAEGFKFGGFAKSFRWATNLM